jgi:SAM-dependent methyltransferase
MRRLARSVLIGTPLEKPARATLQALRRFWIKNKSPQLIKEARPLDTFKAIILPEGVSEEGLRNAMLSISIDGSPPGALNGYVADSFRRFIHTWSMVRDQKGSCLELGANPYFTTFLLNEYTELELTYANYFGGDEGTGRQVVTFESDGVTKTINCEFDHFNMEESQFPYEDNSFDVVLYCEIIEHLLMNPVHTLREIHRVLKPGGIAIVTTPNVNRLGNVVAQVDGRGIYDPYSGFGPYGRHNREYSITELLQLLRFCGFEHESSFTSDAHAEDHSSHPRYADIASLVSHRPAHLGQYLFVAVRATGQPQMGFPSSLYRSYPDQEINNDW